MKEYIVLVFIILNSCASNTVNSDVQLNKFQNSKGLHKNIQLSFNGYKNKNLRIVIPNNISTPKPLIVALHWAGSGETYKEYSQCLVEPAFSDVDCYIISPDGEGFLWTSTYNEEKILSLISLVKKKWNIDNSKIIVTGYSNGGNGAWFFAQKYPQLFKAAIPMASAYPIKSKITIPLYVIHGENDELFNITRTQNWVLSSTKAGSNIVFKAVPEYSHYMACNYVHELKKAVKWLKID